MNALLLLLGLATVGYVIRVKQPRLWDLCGGFLAAGIAPVAMAWNRREAAVRAGHVARGWAHEMFSRADPAVATADAFHAVPLGFVWLVLWALFLYDERTRRRGPWVLALLPLLIVLPMMTVRLGAEGGGSPLPSGIGSIFLLAFGATVIGLAVYWYVRRRA